MKAPFGAAVRLFYDGPPVAPGEVLRTPTGRCYVVLSRRLQQRGAHAGRRQHLGCLVAREPPEGAKVLPLHWYARGARRSQ